MCKRRFLRFLREPSALQRCTGFKLSSIFCSYSRNVCITALTCQFIRYTRALRDTSLKIRLHFLQHSPRYIIPLISSVSKKLLNHHTLSLSIFLSFVLSLSLCLFSSRLFLFFTYLSFFHSFFFSSFFHVLLFFRLSHHHALTFLFLSRLLFLILIYILNLVFLSFFIPFAFLRILCIFMY